MKEKDLSQERANIAIKHLRKLNTQSRGSTVSLLTESDLRDENGFAANSSRGSTVKNYNDAVGMYQITEKDIAKHKESLLRKKQTVRVRSDSIHEMMDEGDMEKHKNVARRVFYNHEVTEARGNHFSHKALK